MPVKVFNILAYGTARPAGHGEIQPCRIWFGMFGCNNFDGIAGFELRTQRHHDIVDTCGNGFVPDIGMHRISKIDRCCTLGQC